MYFNTSFGHSYIHLLVAVRHSLYYFSFRGENLGITQVNTNPTQDRMNDVIAEVSSANCVHFEVSHKEKQIEAFHENLSSKKTSDKRPMSNKNGRKSSPSKASEHSPKLQRRSPRQSRISPSRSPKCTGEVPGSKTTSVSSCSLLPCDVFNCNAVFSSTQKKRILNISSAKRRALMGYNLPEINERHYISCPGLPRNKVERTMCIFRKRFLTCGRLVWFMLFTTVRA